MKLISWNVNGLRAVLNKGFAEFVEKEQPDMLCLQETKARPDQVPYLWPADYHVYWNSAQKPGYSGTLIASRALPLAVVNGMGIAKHDQEGRVITAEYADFFLVTVYTPNSQDGLRRLHYRSTEWDVDFLAYVRRLEREKPVVFCGDLNVAHQEIDLANPKANRMNPGFTDEERAGFDRVVEAGFLDTFRVFNDQPDQYTWWSYRSAARSRNVGWRIDYFCASAALRPRLQRAWIMADVMGSDHCPVGLELSGTP